MKAQKLKKERIKVTIGVLKNEIKKIHAGFFYKLKKNRPFIATKIAISKNGKMINQNNCIFEIIPNDEEMT